MDDPIYIFLHIQKTGGTTIRKHIEKNFSEKEALLLEHQSLRWDKEQSTYSTYYDLAQKRIEKLSSDEKNKLKIIYGHEVPYGIHTLFDRPCRYITIFREPHKRTMSIYNFFRTRYDLEDTKGKRQKHYSIQLLVNNAVPTFASWLKNIYGTLSVETTAQILQLLGYMEGSSQPAIAHALEKFYFIGLTEELNNDALFMYDLLDVRTYFINQNISKKYITQADQNATIELIARKNKHDRILYKKAQNKRRDFILNHPEYTKRVRAMRVRKKLMTPFSQVLFDPYESLYRASSYLKDRSPLYNQCLKFVRRILRV